MINHILLQAVCLFIFFFFCKLRINIFEFSERMPVIGTLNKEKQDKHIYENLEACLVCLFITTHLAYFIAPPHNSPLFSASAHTAQHTYSKERKVKKKKNKKRKGNCFNLWLAESRVNVNLRRTNDEKIKINLLA